MFDLKDDRLVMSSRKLLMFEAENLLELVFCRAILFACKSHSRRLNSGSSSRRRKPTWSMVVVIGVE